MAGADPAPLPAKTTAELATIPKPAVTAFGEFAGWARQFTNGSSSLAEGQRLAFKRRQAMLNLIQTDPAGALA